MHPNDVARESVLLVSACQATCALRIQEVRETMRPLPIEPLGGMPPFIRGIAIVRGEATPVLDLATLLGGGGNPIHRFVSLRLDERPLAIAVEHVLGMADLPAGSLRSFPTLLGNEGSTRIESLGVRDERLLMLLQAARLVPNALWPELQARLAQP